MTKSPAQLDREISETFIGKLVRFKIPAIGGRISNVPTMQTIAGIVKRVMPSGQLEIRAQQGGYYIVPTKDIELTVRK